MGRSPTYPNEKKSAGPRRGVIRAASIIFLVTLLVPAGVSASTVTLPDAYRLAMSSHEAVRIAGEGVSQAGSDLSIATSAMLPKLTAQGAYTKFTDQRSAGTFLIQPDSATNAELKLTQPVFSGGALYSARKSALLNLERSRTSKDFTREGIILITARTYYNTLKRHKDVEIKEAALKRTFERKKVALARFEVGTVVKSAVLRAEAEVAGAEAELITARTLLKDSKSLLRRLLGVRGNIELVEPVKANPPAADIDKLIRTAFASRLDLKETELDKAMASESIRRAKGNFLPTLSLDGRYVFRDQDPKTTFFQSESVSATLTLTYPIFEGGLRRAELSRARSLSREAELRMLGRKRDVELEVRASYNRMEGIQAVIKSYKKQLSFAKEDYKMVFEQFRYGLATTVDVIDSDTELISAERSLVNGVYNLQIVILELKYSVGMLLEEYVE
jgi:outer membrane protein